VQLIQKSVSDYERGGTQKDEYSTDEVVTVRCPLCGSTGAVRLYREHRSLEIKKCSGCSLIYTSPRVKEPEQTYHGQYERYLTEAKLIFSGRATHHRDPNYREELELLERHRPSRGRLLDVGCNMGMLMRIARERGWRPVGVEPSPALHRIATEQLGLEVHNCLLPELPDSEDRAYDVVALSDVFEHISEPRPFLRAVARFLKPDGILYLKVPNARWNILKQQMLQALGRTPSEGVWDSYEHVVHYDHDSLMRMLAAEGYKARELTVSRPVQVPVWHQYVGQYYQYPSPWVLDWKRHLGRLGFYHLSRLERAVRRGAIGYCAPNLVCVATARR